MHLSQRALQPYILQCITSAAPNSFLTLKLCCISQLLRHCPVYPSLFSRKILEGNRWCILHILQSHFFAFRCPHVWSLSLVMWPQRPQSEVWEARRAPLVRMVMTTQPSLLTMQLYCSKWGTASAQRYEPHFLPLNERYISGSFSIKFRILMGCFRNIH